MNKKLDLVVRACEDKKGQDINVIDLKGKTTIADYFVIVTANSGQQIKAISEEIEEKIKEAGFEVNRVEGLRDSAWLLMDLGDIIVHIFSEEQREFYDLEKLWD